MQSSLKYQNKLKKYLSKIRNFFKISLKNKILIFRIMYLSLFYRILILVIPFKKLSKRLGKIKVNSHYEPNESEIIYIKKIYYFIIKVCSKTPWESKCLVQALVGRKLMLKKHIETTLFLGVCKDKDDNMIAHAWLKCGNNYVTGDIKDEFGIVATFTK